MKLSTILIITTLMAFTMFSGCREGYFTNEPPKPTKLDYINADIDIYNLSSWHLKNEILKLEKIYRLNSFNPDASITIWYTLDSSITLPPYKYSTRRWDQLKEHRDEIKRTIETYSNRIILNKRILQTLYVKRAVYK